MATHGSGPSFPADNLVGIAHGDLSLGTVRNRVENLAAQRTPCGENPVNLLNGDVAPGGDDANLYPNGSRRS